MDLKIRFLGAARNVTGSRYLIDAAGLRLLVDCGLYQERTFKHRNWEPFPVPPDSIDCLILTHAHLDHCGYLPRLVRDGFRGPVVTTEASSEIAGIVLRDSARLQEEDARRKLKRHKEEGRTAPFPVQPLYTPADAEQALSLIQGVNYNEAVPVGKGAEVTFREAGHILGASSVHFRFTQGNEARTLVFSGDIGRWDRPLLEDPFSMREADYVVMESTYGNRIHNEEQSVEDALTEVIHDTRVRGGNIIIPSFAVERAHELLYYLNKLLRAKRIPPLMTFLDSPMAQRVTRVFERHLELTDAETRDLFAHHQSPFSFKGLVMSETADQSKAINELRGTAIVIAGNGMCTGGRIKHHLINNLGRAESSVLFVGYQAEGTLGRQILDGAKEVRVLGRMIKVRAHVRKIAGLSAHADREELLKWVSGLRTAPPRRVFVTHGEEKTALEFGKTLQRETGWPVTVPVYDEVAVLS